MSVRCPYDPNHIMPRQSLTNHIRKCKAPNKHLFVQCKYNLQHIIRKENINKHYQTAHAKEKGKVQEFEDDWLSDEQKKPLPKKDDKQQKVYEKSWLKGDHKEEASLNWEVSMIQHEPEEKPKKKKKNHFKVEEY